MVVAVVGNIFLYFFSTQELLELFRFVHNVFVDWNQVLIAQNSQGRFFFVIKRVFVLKLFEPLVFFYSIQTVSPIWVSCQNSPQELLTGRRHSFGNSKFSCNDFFVQS